MTHRYCQYRLSEATHGTGPSKAIADRGGRLEPSWAVREDGYRVGLLIEHADVTGLEDWDLSEITETEALAFHAEFYPDTYVLDDGMHHDGHFFWPRPPEDVE